MASRRRAREFALQALYQADITSGPAGTALQRLWDLQLDSPDLEPRPAESEEIDFASRIAQGVDGRRVELDGLIEAASRNWRLARMPVVDRNILRMASFELVGAKDVPPNVAINEALELAKRFGDKDSRAFVNGILDKVAADTGRGGGGQKRGRNARRRR